MTMRERFALEVLPWCLQKAFEMERQVKGAIPDYRKTLAEAALLADQAAQIALQQLSTEREETS